MMRRWLPSLAIPIIGLAACPAPGDSKGHDTAVDTEVSPHESDTGLDSSSDTDTAVETAADTDTSIDTSFVVELDPAADAKLVGEEGRDAYGLTSASIAVAAGGDVDADGIPDLLVGMGGSQLGGEVAAGTTYLVRGPITGSLDLSLADARLYGTTQEASGYAVSFAGDVNADGYDDIVIGAPFYYPSDLDHAGRAYVVYGPVVGDRGLDSAEAILLGLQTSVYDYASSGYTGYSVASAGDTNGDGYSDVLIGASTVAYLMLGPVAGDIDLPTQADVQIKSDEYYFGQNVSSAGDPDGDGLGDVLVGNPGNGGQVVSLFNGPLSGTLAPSDADAFFSQGYDGEGYAQTSAGDLNDDGYSDLLLCACSYDDLALLGGAAYVVFGPVAGEVELGAVADKVVGDEAGASAGWGLDAAGDVNGDGAPDILVGAPATNPDGPGTTYVVLGPIAGTSILDDAAIELHGEGDDQVGFAVAGAGDIDNDGLDDVFMGGPGDDDGGENAGAAWLVLGSSMK